MNAKIKEQLNINTERITVNKVAQYLDISVVTLNNWYKWYQNFDKPKNTPFLPPYQQDNPRGVRYWTEHDLYDLKKFKEWIPKGRGGVMGESNASFWGERGKRALQNKTKTRKTPETNKYSKG